jgi:hypothetical protein
MICVATMNEIAPSALQLRPERESAEFGTSHRQYILHTFSEITIVDRVIKIQTFLISQWWFWFVLMELLLLLWYCLCGLLVRVPGYRSGGPGFDFRRYQIFWEVVCPERGPLGLVRITEELLEWKGSGFGSRKRRLTATGMRCADQATLFIKKIGTNYADKRRWPGRYISLSD